MPHAAEDHRPLRLAGLARGEGAVVGHIPFELVREYCRVRGIEQSTVVRCIDRGPGGLVLWSPATGLVRLDLTAAALVPIARDTTRARPRRATPARRPRRAPASRPVGAIAIVRDRG